MELKQKAITYLKSKNIELDSTHATIQTINKICPSCIDGDDKLYIKGYITTFENMDLEGDIVDKEAFNETLKVNKVVPLLRNHVNSTKDQMGAFTKFTIDDKGVLAEGYISNTPETNHERQLIKDGALNSFSMGGLCKYENNKMIKDVILLEASIVPIPANDQAKFKVKTIQEKSKAVQPMEPKESITTRIKRLKKLIKEQIK